MLVCGLGEASLDLDEGTVTTPDGAQPFLSARWPTFGEFLHGRHSGGMDYDCDGSVLRRFIYGWIQDDFRAVKEGLKNMDAVGSPRSQDDSAGESREVQSPDGSASAETA